MEPTISRASSEVEPALRVGASLQGRNQTLEEEPDLRGGVCSQEQGQLRDGVCSQGQGQLSGMEPVLRVRAIPGPQLSQRTSLI